MNNLDRKTLIQAAVIFACMGSAVYVLYSHFFNNESKQLQIQAMENSVDIEVANIKKSVPSIEKIDFSVLNRPNVVYGQVVKFEPATKADLGVDVNQLVAPKVLNVNP